MTVGVVHSNSLCATSVKFCPLASQVDCARAISISKSPEPASPHSAKSRVAISHGLVVCHARAKVRCAWVSGSCSVCVAFMRLLLGLLTVFGACQRCERVLCARR